MQSTLAKSLASSNYLPTCSRCVEANSEEVDEGDHSSAPAVLSALLDMLILVVVGKQGEGGPGEAVKLEGDACWVTVPNGSSGATVEEAVIATVSRLLLPRNQKDLSLNKDLQVRYQGKYGGI